MATTRKASKKPVLPGLSRSIACQRSARCLRLDGHKGPHRQSLTATPKVSAEAKKAAALKGMARTAKVIAKVGVTTEGGVEVLSADRYTVQPEPKAPARRARRPKVVVIPMADYKRLVAAGHKVTKSRGYIVSGKPSARLA
jgi:hypothetical protein